MKKSNFKIYVTAFSLISLVGCIDLGDVKDYGSYSPDNVWNDEKLSSAYLSSLYANVLGGFPVNSGNNADESGGILGRDAVQTNNGSFKYWPYGNIRNINVMLKEIDMGTMSDQKKNPMKAQAMFLRAYLYFNAVKHHGGVPIIKVPQEMTDDLQVTRNTTAECFDFILEDLDYALQNLPEKNSGKDYGRIDQAAVLAFKAKVLLYKASPQFNPTNPYGNKYWADAFQATKEAKEKLEQWGYSLVPNYNDVFMTENHVEAVLPVVFKDPGKTNGRREDMVRPLSESKNSTGGDQPIWALVSAYPMKDGKAPGISNKYTYQEQTFWKDRDPRFYSTVVYNGAVYELSGKKGRRQYTTPNLASSLDAFGINIQGEHHYRTGLFCRKGIMESLSSAQATLNGVDWLEIRYAEVLFNYAEAANEMGDVSVGYDVLTRIRQRAGLEPGTDGLYGLKAGMSREEMRMALLDEKYIEFAFEGHRFWDLRRHRLFATKLDGIRKYGVHARVKESISPEKAMEMAAKYQLLPEDFDYDIMELITTGEKQMSLPDTYYFFPIHKDEIEKNPKLEQNVNWGGNFDPTLQ